MIDVVIVRVNNTGNIYYLSPGDFSLKQNDKVIVDTENGLQIGEVIKEKYQEKTKNLVLPLNKVIRICTAEDFETEKANNELAEKAFNYAKNCVKELELEMYFVDSYFSLDKNQLIFNFVSDNRIDFRDLAKKLAQKYKTRIELRQIGVRDKAKKIGGLGPCGLFLCCNSFLTDFNSVSINMAKNQFLALNPSKINGVCGRLLCCLGYENDTYTDLKKGFPKIGMMADTPLGMGKVQAIDIFKNTYQVDLGEQGLVEFSKDE